MAWTEDRSEPFVNPYNFIRIMDHNCKREKLIKGNLTGVIKCSLITKTPTIIPNTSNNNAFCEKVYDKQGKEILDKDGKNVARSYNFFSYDDLSDNEEGTKKDEDAKKAYYEPIIPGSEIRGVIRTSYEAVTNSCLSSIDIDRILHQRTSKVKQKAGILVKQNDNWMIQEADTYMTRNKSKRCDYDSFRGIDINDYKEGQEVYITISRDKYRNRSYMPKTVTRVETRPFPGSIRGFIHIGEDIKKKHHERIFVPNKDLKPVPIGEKAVKNLEKLMELYRDEKLNKNINTPQDRVKKHTGYKNFKVKEGALIYYNNDLKYLSPSLITREVFDRKVNELLGDFVPCEKMEKKKDENLLCDACRVFGMISDNGKSVGSRIRFSDAKVINERNNEEYYLKDMIINELSSPKISSTEFYMEKPNRVDCDTWNYDYTTKWDRNTTTSIPKAYIRGRKFYWHHIPQCDKDQELNERNCKVRILDVDNEFKFDVFYENLKQEELKKLVWTLSIGNRKDSLHKIGKGKPLGFGSVKINVDEIWERKIVIKDDSIEYYFKDLKITDEAEREKLIDIKSRNVNEFLAITDFNATKGLKVCYPIGDDGSDSENAKAGHQWFLGNRFNDVRGGAMKPKINKSLPEIKKPVAVLYKFKNQGVRRQ